MSHFFDSVLDGIADFLPRIFMNMYFWLALACYPGCRRTMWLWKMRRLPSGRALARGRRGAFTLIELLIVVSIVTLFAGAAYTTISDVTRLGEETTLRVTARNAAEDMLDAWARDVNLSSASRLEPKGMSVSLPGEQGAETTHRYALDAQGRCVQSDAVAGASAKPTAVLAPLAGVTELSFTPDGNGWHAKITVHRTTGRRDWTWTFERWAAPLLPAAPGATAPEATP